MNNDMENLKASLQNKLKAMQGLPNPNDNTSAMFSNSNKINLPDNPFSIVSKDVVINASKPELPNDVLAPSNVHDIKARNEYMAQLKLTDPGKYKIEYSKEQWNKKMIELSRGYEASNIERDKRRK